MEQETQELIDKAVKEKTKGLKKNVSDLLKEKKDILKKFSAFEDVDVDQLLKDAKAFNEAKEKAEEEKGEYKKMYEKQKTQHSKEIDKLKKELADAQAGSSTLKKSTELGEALVEAGVLPEMSKSANKLLLDDLSITDENKVVVGDKTVLDHVKEWKKTDTGKHFFSNGNSGGGATGPGGESSAESAYFDKKSDKFSRTKQAEITKKNPQLAAKLREQYKNQ